MINYNKTMREIMTGNKPLPPHLQSIHTERQKYELNSGMVTHNKLPDGTYYTLDMYNAYLNSLIQLIQSKKLDYNLNYERINDYLDKKRDSSDKNVCKKVFFSHPEFNQFTSFQNMIIDDLTLDDEQHIWLAVTNHINKKILQQIHLCELQGIKTVKRSLDGIYLDKKPNHTPEGFYITKKVIE